MFKVSPYILLRRLLLFCLGVLSAIALWKLGAQVYYEMLGKYYQDISIYLAVGRGVLNGLMPYVDLFETKPPGIFLLAALSLHLFGDARLLLFVCALLIGLLPLWLMLPMHRSGERSDRWLRILIAFCFGTFIALFTAERAGQGLVESLGAFFATGIVALSVLNPKHFPWRITIAVALLFAFAVGLKEPFLISAIGGVLIVSPSFRATQRLLFPLIIAGVLCIFFYFTLGYLGPYFSIYLPHMLGHQIVTPWGTIPDPLWLRTIDLSRMFRTMWEFSVFLPFVIGMLWIAALGLMILRSSTRREKMFAAMQWLLGSWFLTLSVGISGDFYPHQFVFAVPGFCAFFFVCMQERHRLLSSTIGKGILTVWLMLLAAGLIVRPAAPLRLEQEWKDWVAERTEAAAVIDAVMERCEIDKYLLLIAGNDSIHAYTHHSPYGPLFTNYARFVAGHPLFIEAFGRQFHTASLAVYKDDQPRPLLDEESIHEFQTAFTEEPPACAGSNFKQPLPYHIIFRIVKS